ncbi:DivIVA domain-containing protein [Paenarthrobacter sp. PH39-S1]|uniref:DivIVA domain-containing protein n=1 Tax=Paenarthrobacter sp. PH39-S1 TaxID=3046204 RepID=UPI0024B969B5|nr:DivIVA domain-containing protein [Paenarthrobacter sp. PH39-S1]MDJ0358002.1 DivIVA domain-containing protein [Paenarthrobacter sp. PH39-S1]
MTVDKQQRTNTPFARVGRNEFGYSIKQVDHFLTRAHAFYTAEDSGQKTVTSHDVRTVSFDPAKGGYQALAVDAALDRLEDVFAQRERDQLVSCQGEEAWLLQIGRISSVLRARLHRGDGERFRRPKRRVRSYCVEEVDGLCRELLAYFEENKPMSVDIVRRAVFAPAVGAEGYEESQVDAFLDRVVELMASID